MKLSVLFYTRVALLVALCCRYITLFITYLFLACFYLSSVADSLFHTANCVLRRYSAQSLYLYRTCLLNA